MWIAEQLVASFKKLLPDRSHSKISSPVKTIENAPAGNYIGAQDCLPFGCHLPMSLVSWATKTTLFTHCISTYMAIYQFLVAACFNSVSLDTKLNVTSFLSGNTMLSLPASMREWGVLKKDPPPITWRSTAQLPSRDAIMTNTVYPKKYAHGFVVLWFVVVMQSFIMNSHEIFIHIHQGCFAGTGAIVRLPQCQWSKPDGYWKISQWLTTTKHSKAKTVCIFLGIYCKYNKRQLWQVIPSFDLVPKAELESRDDGAYSRDETDVTMVLLLLKRHWHQCSLQWAWPQVSAVARNAGPKCVWCRQSCCPNCPQHKNLSQVVW